MAYLNKWISESFKHVISLSFELYFTICITKKDWIFWKWLEIHPHYQNSGDQYFRRRLIRHYKPQLSLIINHLHNDIYWGNTDDSQKIVTSASLSLNTALYHSGWEWQWAEKSLDSSGIRPIGLNSFDTRGLQAKLKEKYLTCCYLLLGCLNNSFLITMVIVALCHLLTAAGVLRTPLD